MYGEKIHEGRGTVRRYPREKGSGRDEPINWREVWSEPETSIGTHQSSKSKGTNGSSGICGASEGTTAEGRRQRRSQAAQ